MEGYICPICGNSDSNSIGIRNGKFYCRKCLVFKGKEADYFQSNPKKADYFLNYELSEEQLKISNSLINNFISGRNSLIHAVCGSGKTEIVLGVIKYAIENGYKVGFAIPRRDVVIEISERLHHIFTKNKIVTVIGGKTNNLYGDIVCLTTHQLYHYNYYFDLLIVDEIDAFPFKDNKTLESFFDRSIKKNYILMSATLTEKQIQIFKLKGGEVLSLNTRFHRFPLPVPKIVIANKFILFIKLIVKLKNMLKDGKQVFIFVPTIEMCETIYRLISFLVKQGTFVHSKCSDREKKIENFKNKKYQYLVTTAVLERGVTVRNLQVMVYKSNHSIYNASTLIQISGRVGRKKDAPEGEVIFYGEKETKAMDDSIEGIVEANKNLQNMF